MANYFLFDVIVYFLAVFSMTTFLQLGAYAYKLFTVEPGLTVTSPQRPHFLADSPYINSHNNCTEFYE